MKRLLVGVVVVAVLAVFIARRSRHAVADGPWHGETSQGLPLELRISDDEIIEWLVFMDLRCERTERVIHAGVMSTIPVAIVDGAFEIDLRFIDVWLSWRGKLRGEDEARGDLGAVWAALDGDEIRALTAEKCSVFDVGWTAQPGEAPEKARRVDLELRVERGRDGRPRITRGFGRSGAASRRDGP